MNTVTTDVLAVNQDAAHRPTRSRSPGCSTSLGACFFASRPGWCGCHHPGPYILSGRGYRTRAAKAAMQQTARRGATHAENALGCPTGVSSAAKAAGGIQIMSEECGPGRGGPNANDQGLRGAPGERRRRLSDRPGSVRLSSVVARNKGPAAPPEPPPSA